MTLALLEGWMGSPYALPVTAAAVILLLYFLLATCAAVGRLRFYRRPADAPLITGDGPGLGERLQRELMAAFVREGSPSPRLRNGRRLAVVFASPACAPCLDLLPDLASVARRWRVDTSLVVLLETGGLAESHPSLQDWTRLPLPVLRDPDGELTRDCGVRHRPFALLLDSDGVVLMKGIVSSGRHLDVLLQEWGVPAAGREWKVVG